MPKTFTSLSVFISCPSNLSALRGVAEAAIKEVSDVLEVTRDTRLVAVSWSSDIIPGVAQDAQQVINEQTIGQYDIYLGLMGARFGTETLRAGSGTEEEFDLARKTFENDAESIRILFYLQAFGVNPFTIDPTQLIKVKAFQQKLQTNGVFYKELESLDDALTSFKSHLLKLITQDWDKAAHKWRVPLVAADSLNVAGNEKLTIMDSSQAFVEPDSNDEELGIIELNSVVTEEFNLVGLSIQAIGSNLNKLTDQMTRLTALGMLEPHLGANTLKANIDDFADEIQSFVRNSRGELANMRFHGDKGAGTIEQYFSLLKTTNFSGGGSAKDVVVAVEQVEPSIRGFRDMVVASKSQISTIPPMTKKLRGAQRALAVFFDDLSVELTILLERLALLRTRLATHDLG